MDVRANLPFPQGRAELLRVEITCPIPLPANESSVLIARTSLLKMQCKTNISEKIQPRDASLQPLYLWFMALFSDVF